MNRYNNSEELDAIFDALANARRRDMIYRLSLRPYRISDLAAAYGITLPSMNKHLKVFDGAGLIRRKKVGRTTFIALDKQSLSQAQAWLGVYQTYWGNDQETLENYASRTN